MIHIRFSGVESDKYFIEADEEYLGRQWDNLSEAVSVEIPREQTDSTCTMIFAFGKKLIDAISVIDNIPITIKNNISQYQYVDVSFRFERTDGYLKNTEIKRFYFAEAQKPVDFIPEEPTIRKAIDEIIAKGYADSTYLNGVLTFKNVNDQTVKTIDIGSSRGGSVIEHLDEIPTPSELSPDLVNVNGKLYAKIGTPTPPPILEGKLYIGCVDTIEENILDELSENDLPENILENGISATYTTAGNQYECVAYPSIYGDLTQIYESGLPFNLIDQFERIVRVKDEIEYFVYHRINKVITENDEYQFKFN